MKKHTYIIVAKKSGFIWKYKSYAYRNRLFKWLGFDSFQEGSDISKEDAIDRIQIRLAEHKRFKKDKSKPVEDTFTIEY